MTVSFAPYFHRFDQSVKHIPLPSRFTYPFCYDPHPLCIAAANQLQNTIQQQNLLDQHYATQSQGEYAGKMFGVLVVKTAQGELGYLAGFSGKLAGSNHYDGFVPPVYDMLTDDNLFLQESAEINQLNQQIAELSQSVEAQHHHHSWTAMQRQAKAEIQAQQQAMIQSRQQRKIRRQAIHAMAVQDNHQHQLDELARQSVAEKRILTQLKIHWQTQLDGVKQQIEQHQHTITTLKQQRKIRSQQLQHRLFANYQFLNAHGETLGLMALFKDTMTPVPPAGSGECAAPKMLHFAYQHQLTPVAMAEFWWGNAPKSAIRQHRNFYPACQSKCFPILSHMLKGLDVDPNPLLTAPKVDRDIDIIYQDEAIVVLNKPAELLSVPGVHIEDSAFTRLKTRLGNREEGPYVLHRLDMATSGLLVFALTKRANKSLQKQFISRDIEKRYVADLSGYIDADHGYIHLPLAADPDDRPRQQVCERRGKPAETYWEKIHATDTQTRLYLYPKTGRTHQLRVHCAHHQGLNTPIIGDDLYGYGATRLHLHADKLSFSHPYTRERLTFHVPAEF